MGALLFVILFPVSVFSQIHIIGDAQIVSVTDTPTTGKTIKAVKAQPSAKKEKKFLQKEEKSSLVKKVVTVGIPQQQKIHFKNPVSEDFFSLSGKQPASMVLVFLHSPEKGVAEQHTLIPFVFLEKEQKLVFTKTNLSFNTLLQKAFKTRPPPVIVFS